MPRDYYSHSARSVASTSATPYDTPRSEWGSASAAEGPSSSSHQQLIRASDARPSLSLLKQEILSEEEYVETLSDIIKRDFFPALRSLDAQHEILQAYESEDPARIEESVRRMREIVTPTPRRRARGDTPGHTPFATSHADTPTYFGQTPDSRYTPRLPSRSTPAPAPPRIDPNISLDTFQARYTSEDNSSFAVLLAKDNQTRREKHAWAWQAEEKAKQKAIRGREARERLVDVTQKMVEGSKDGIVRLLEGPAGRPGERRLVVEGVEGVSVGERESRLMVEGKREGVLLLTNGGGEGRISKEEMGKGKGKQVMTLTDGKERQFVDWDKATVEEDEDNRLPKVGDMQVPIDTWSFKNRNSFMFPPDADVALASEVPGALSQAAAAAAKKDPLLLGEPKGVRYHATRLEQIERPAKVPGAPSPSRSRIGAAIAGTPYHAAQSRTPKVSGFSFVDALPSPSAASLDPKSLQELMTWGTIEATPVTLRSSSDLGLDGSGPFRINDSSRRETLAHKMANKAKRSLADKASNGQGRKSGLAVGGLRRSVLESTRGGGERTPGGATPGGSSPRASSGNLSPAAKTLLSGTKQGRLLEKGEEEERRRVERAKQRAREVESRERLRRERWTASPALSLGFDPEMP